MIRSYHDHFEEYSRLNNIRVNVIYTVCVYYYGVNSNVSAPWLCFRSVRKSGRLTVSWSHSLRSGWKLYLRQKHCIRYFFFLRLLLWLCSFLFSHCLVFSPLKNAGCWAECLVKSSETSRFVCLHIVKLLGCSGWNWAEIWQGLGVQHSAGE